MDFIFIESKEQTNELIRELLTSNELGLDVETTSLDPYSAIWLLLQLEINNKIYVLDVRKLGLDFISYIIQLIKDSNKLVVGHNIKYDNEIIKINTGEFIHNLYDTMLAEILINQGIGQQFYSFKDIVYKYFTEIIDKSERLTFENYKEDYFTNDQIVYSALDVKYLREIKEKQLKILQNQKQADVLNLENRLITPVCSIELNGVLLDEKLWAELIEKAKADAEIHRKNLIDTFIDTLDTKKYSDLLDMCSKLNIPVKTKKLRTELEMISDPKDALSWVKNNFNTNSPTQIKAILNELGMNVDSTGEKVLNEYLKRNPKKSNFVKLLLDYREKEKKITTYGESYFELIHPRTERIHLDHNQLGTYTGRFSVSRLHQIPRESEYRKAFIARPGYKIITADLDQAELRLIGADSQEPKFIHAFKTGLDLHRLTASILFDKQYADVTKEERQSGKNFNFALQYGTTEYGLSFNFGIGIDLARELLDKFYKGYPVLAEYLEYLGNKIWDAGFCPTMLGRRRYFSKRTLFDSSKEMVRYRARMIRELRNHRIQGTCADIIKIAMNDLYYENPFGEDFRLLTQIHDEIVMEAKEEIIEPAVDFVKKIMLNSERPFLGEIEPAVSISYGDYWSK